MKNCDIYWAFSILVRYASVSDPQSLTLSGGLLLEGGFFTEITVYCYIFKYVCYVIYTTKGIKYSCA